jgi:PAS domain S-box-containing protein
VKEHQDQFRALAESAADAIVTIDERDRVVYANPAAARLFGYTVRELTALPFTQLIPERLRERHRDGLRHYLETGERRIRWDGVELPGLRRDGSEVPLEITFGQYRTEDGLYFTGVMRDLSQRHAQKLTLRETAETLAAIVHDSPFAVVGLSAEGRVVFWNPRAEVLFGWAEDEVIGKAPPVLPSGH